MNAFDLLKADHRKVAELFEQLETAGGVRKLDVFKRIKSEVELHTHIEETIFYPALEKPEATHDLTLEAYEEHNLVKSLLGELSGAQSATDEWQAKAKVLRENVEHHVDEEESELFDKADDVLTDEEIEALGNRMAAEKARQQGQPVPKETQSGEKGIIAKIKDFVGLGDSGENKKAAKKKAAKSAPVKKAAAKKVAVKKAPVKKVAAKKKAGAAKGSKKTSAAPRKRAAATAGSKRAAGSKSGSRKQSAAKSAKKSKKGNRNRK